MSSVLLSGLLDRKLAGPAVREEGPEQPFRGRGVPELMAPPPWARPLFRACVQIRTQLVRSHDDKVGGVDGETLPSVYICVRTVFMDFWKQYEVKWVTVFSL